MKFFKPSSFSELFNYLDDNHQSKYFLAGGTDINVQIQNNAIKEESEIYYINHLTKLKGIQEEDEFISIGAATDYYEIIHSSLLSAFIPFFQSSLKNFASPILQTLATIGGNIANGSPTNDVSPLLLIYDAELELISSEGIRKIPIRDFFTGYKSSVLKYNEIIKSILIPKDAETDYITFFQKVGSRKALIIAKATLAGLKKVEDNIIKEIKLAACSLTEIPKRLTKMENYLLDKKLNELDLIRIEEILKTEITPITDLRSDKDYRFEVCLNMLRNFIAK